MIFKDRSYSWSVILAILLHVAILLFLLVKFIPRPKKISTNQPANIVQATIVRQTPVELPPKEQPIAEKPNKPAEIPVAKPVIKPMPEKPKKIEKKTTTTEQRKIQQQNLQQQIAAEKKQLANQIQAQEAQTEIDKYKALILQTISSYWIVPENLDKGLFCQLLVHVGPGGVVLKVDLIRSSGNYLLDSSAKSAVLKASPLPVPTDPSLFDNFRLIKLTVRPEGIQ
jgi:colicin import membrane protein